MATEVIHTVIPAGGGDYTTITAWEAAQQRNLVSADEIAVAECHTGTSTEQPRIAGWTTDATRYAHVRAAAGHEHGGDFSAGFKVTASSGGTLLQPDSYCRYTGIVIENTGTGGACVDFNTTQSQNKSFHVAGCLIKGNADGIKNEGSGVVVFIYNNIILDPSTECIIQNNATGTIHVYNNTLIGGTHGIRNVNGACRPKNNVAQGNSTACYNGTMTDSEGNISSDATSPQTGLRNITLDFVDGANDDYHLAATDTAAIDVGIDLSADGTLAFAIDVDGQSRPQGPEWDIGADEFMSGVRKPLLGLAGLFVAGGTEGSPTNLGTVLSNNLSTSVFLLGDGWYSNPDINRSNVIVRAVNKHQARLTAGMDVNGDNVIVNGVSRITTGVGIQVFGSGCSVLNCHVSGFGKTDFGTGIWVLKEALVAGTMTLVKGNLVEDFGGDDFISGIAVGMQVDTQDINDIRVTISHNTVIGAPNPPDGIFNASIQFFFPALVHHNFCDTISGTPIQNKSRNSHVHSNEMVNCFPDGCLYNREESNNLWEYNYIHDCEVGIDHFKGENCVYRYNVIANVESFGRIKNSEGGASHNIIIENNTFFNASASGWFWDQTGGGTFDDILWRRNIWHTNPGAAIQTGPGLSAWDETDNLFFQTTEPTGTTGAGGTSDADIDPQFVGGSPSFSYEAQAPEAAGRGAPWPLPWM